MQLEHRQHVLEKIRRKIAEEFPAAPGVYIFEDTAGVTLYVGKAKNLKSRAGSYFQPSSNLLQARGLEIARMVDDLVCDVNFIECDSEVDALLRENRLIKDIQPRFNERQKDDKSFPYLQIRTAEDFPRVSITRKPESRGVKLYGPFVRGYDLKLALPMLQRVFKFRTCKLDIADGDENRKKYRPCILHNIKQCTAPCAARVSRDDYRSQIDHFRKFLESKGSQLRKELFGKMQQAAADKNYEKAAEYRDELKSLQSLQERGLADENVQPEVFYVDPAEGLQKLGEILGLSDTPRTIEGIDIAHLQGKESCGSLVCFIDGKPFKNSYRRYKIKTVEGNDDFASIREIVSRRYRLAGHGEQLFPDVIMIDGGKGQLEAAHQAFAKLEIQPPMLISLAKREEEIFILGVDEPVRLARNNPALRLVQSVRDEAHRFAQHYHHILRRKATLDR